MNSIVDMGRNFFAEAGWTDICDWRDDMAAISLTDMIKSNDAIMIVAEKEGIIIGMAGALLFPVWFNPMVRMGQELFWYVDPKERGKIGKKILEMLEREAMDKGAEAFAMLSVDSLPSLDNFYHKWGYRASEKTFIRRLN